jgi:5'-phosphate synthase pdxT subunit
VSLIGILAVQGAFAPHAKVLATMGHETVLIRGARDLGENVEGLIFPGGESTVQLGLIADLGLEAPLRAFVASGKPVLATCAGLILLAAHVRSPEQRSLAVLEVTVARNAWGRQVDSFEATSDAGAPLVFIRAPRIIEVAPGVEILDRYLGEPILVRQRNVRNVTAATFHPELGGTSRLHEAVFGSARL